MTIAATNDGRMEYAGNDSTLIFAYDFQILVNTDLVVTLVTTATGVEAIKVLDTHYTVSGAGGDSGGNVTMIVEPATGETLVIERHIPATQGTDLTAHGAIVAETLENDLDKLCMLIQQNIRDVARSVRHAVGTLDSVDVKLPPPLASNYLAWNSSANAIVNVAAVTPSASVSPFMITVLDDTTAPAALTTLGLTTFIQTLTDDTTAGAALTTLGLTAFIQTLTDDANAATAQTTLDVFSRAAIQNSAHVHGTSAGSSSTYTLTLAPAMTAYAAGQHFTFKANHANTGAATINVNGVGAKAIQRNLSALVAGEIAVNEIVEIIYDGTQFQLVSGVASTLALANDANNRVVTAVGDGTINGEANLTFDGSTLTALTGVSYVQTDSKMFLGDTANGQLTLGITINQGAADDEIITLKSSDVAHGGYSIFSTEADTFGKFRKGSATAGGLSMEGFSEGTTGLYAFSYHQTQPATSPGTAVSTSAIINYAAAHDGAYGYDADSLIWGLRRITDGGNWRSLMFIDEDGDIHLDGSSNDTAFDEEDDAMLCRSLDLMRAPKNVIRSEFDSWTTNHKSALEDAGIISKIDPEDPHHWEDGKLSDPMVNITQLQRLHNGAIWQQRAMFETMKAVADEMLPGFSQRLNDRLVQHKLPALPAT